MGTRSQTIFIEKFKNTKGEIKKEKICIMYRQMDGYPSGHGQDLAEFLTDGVLVNGINSAEKRKIFNGMGCLTAQVIAHFKKGAGSIYIYSPSTPIGVEDYIYEIEGDEKHNLTMRCFETSYNDKTHKSSKGKMLFEGKPETFKTWLEKYNK